MSNMVRELKEQEWYATLYHELGEATIRIKPICCLKYCEPGLGKCTGCPELCESERTSRLLQRIEKQAAEK